MDKLLMQLFAENDYTLPKSDKEAFHLQHNFRFGIAKTTPTDPTAWSEYMAVAGGITEIEVESNEETETDFYYDGGGMGETSVIGMTKTWTFEGHRKYGNPAQDYILDELSHTMGDSRKVYFFVRFPNDIILHAPATVSEIKDPSGSANTKGEISFAISFDGLPNKVMPTQQVAP